MLWNILVISPSHAVWTDEQTDTDGPATNLQNKNQEGIL